MHARQARSSSLAASYLISKQLVDHAVEPAVSRQQVARLQVAMNSKSGLPTVGGERVHGSCGVASQPPATAGWWPPTFATMMQRPCDASRCFQTDRLGQRVP